MTNTKPDFSTSTNARLKTMRLSVLAAIEKGYKSYIFTGVGQPKRTNIEWLKLIEDEIKDRSSSE